MSLHDFKHGDRVAVTSRIAFGKTWNIGHRGTIQRAGYTEIEVKLDRVSTPEYFAPSHLRYLSIVEQVGEL